MSGFGNPLIWSLVELVLKARTSTMAKVGLNMILVLIIFTVGENIDSLSYLYWPGLVILGITFKEKFSSLSRWENQFSTLN